MVYFLIFLGFLAYSVQCYISYTHTLKLTNWYFPALYLTGIVTMTLWGYIAKITQSTTEIYKYSLIWDASLLFSYFLMPLILYNVKLSLGSAVGAAMVLGGATLVKFSS